ncbi:MAG: hypothetical protein J7599_12385 [Niabella sp.]|nr:hypothetical protein [Niabella sp.]
MQLKNHIQISCHIKNVLPCDHNDEVTSQLPQPATGKSEEFIPQKSRPGITLSLFNQYSYAGLKMTNTGMVVVFA